MRNRFSIPLGLILSLWVSVASAAISVTQLTSGTNFAGGISSFSTASVTPGSNHLILIAVSNNTGVGTFTGCTGNGLTWVQVRQQVSAVSTGANMAVFRALGASPSAGAITCTFSTTSAGYIWQVYDISGVDTTGTNGSGAVVQSAIVTASGSIPTATLAAFGSASNGTVGVIYEAAAGGTISAATGFTLIAGPNTTNVGEWRTDNSTAVTFTEASPPFPGPVIFGAEIAVPAAASAAPNRALLGVGK